MEQFRILPGLPSTGPLPDQFSATGQGKHREGFVVEFLPAGEHAWTGNFQPGVTGYCTVIPQGKNLIVVARGQAYLIDPQNRELIAEFGGSIDTSLPVPAYDLFVFTTEFGLRLGVTAA